jgi:hypothetical protein
LGSGFLRKSEEIEIEEALCLQNAARALKRMLPVGASFVSGRILH